MSNSIVNKFYSTLISRIIFCTEEDAQYILDKHYPGYTIKFEQGKVVISHNGKEVLIF